MELPVVDVTQLPDKFKKLFSSALNVVSLCKTTFYGGSESMRIPISLRMEYNNIHHMHFGFLREDINTKDSQEFKTAAGRFDIFNPGSGGIKLGTNISSVENSIGLMLELAQIVLVTIKNSYDLAHSKYKFVNRENCLIRVKAEHNLQLAVLKAYKMAVAYSGYRDESLIKKLEQEIIDLGLVPVDYTGIKMPDVGLNYQNAAFFKTQFQTFYDDIFLYKDRIDKMSRYIDPDLKDYTDDMTRKYADIAKSFLVYPMLFEKPEELK